MLVKVTQVLLLVLAFGLATYGLGWWSVPIVAMAWGALSEPRSGAAWKSALAASLSWAALLGWTALTGPLGALAERLTGIFPLPGWALLLVTCLFPALLAAPAALVTARTGISPGPSLGRKGERGGSGS